MGKTIMSLFFAVTSLCAFFLLTACGDEGCTESTVSYTVAGIVQKQVSSKTAIKTVSVYGIDQGKDTAMVNGQSDLKVISLLLNPDTVYTAMDFVFSFAEMDTIRDTIEFYYKNQEYFLTIDCGCTVYNYLDSIKHTDHLIKNIEIINPEVKNEKSPNITLYY
ncbi:MAG: DUF6452 family protein [Bacteroidales bacterium]